VTFPSTPNSDLAASIHPGVQPSLGGGHGGTGWGQHAQMLTKSTSYSPEMHPQVSWNRVQRPPGVTAPSTLWRKLPLPMLCASVLSTPAGQGLKGGPSVTSQPKPVGHKHQALTRKARRKKADRQDPGPGHCMCGWGQGL
jgi:hypothetical protein